MSFNPDVQYRCTIVRGKSISRMDDYLPVYAEILNEICPIPAEQFDDTFDKKLSHYIKDDYKTIKNHRTENVDKLLGMYFEKDGVIYLSERTNKFLVDTDQPAFFKSVCFRFQQPNGSQKLYTTSNKVEHEVNFKPYHFILALLKSAASKSIVLTKMEVAYYVLNALEVLQGRVSVDEVLQTILSDRAKKVDKRVELPGKASSYTLQHINEQFAYLELANLIRKDRVCIWLNSRESASTELFVRDLAKPLAIDFSKYNFDEIGSGRIVELEWQEYFCGISETESRAFVTNISSLEPVFPTDVSPKVPFTSAIELGDEGETFVLQFERDLVKAFNPRLVNKVNFHGKQRGLGYDITSIEASRNRKHPEYLRYIEVKATKRVHPPDFTDTLDTINLTRNEWVAAEQQSNHFYIYRIYFTTGGTVISIINDPVKKNDDELLYATPTIYRLEFGEAAVDETLRFD